MNRRIAALAGTLILAAGGLISPSSVAAAGEFQLEPTITFTSTRDNLALSPIFGAEIYLIKPVMNPDETWALTNPRRLTNDAFGDALASLSPDGNKIVFDSNRVTAGTLCKGVSYNNISDLFLMNTDGTEQTLLTRGSSATWSPDGKTIAFHASASYHASGGLVTECPIRSGPGAPGSATSDSDIFVVNVDDLLAGVEQPKNITLDSDPLATWIDDDPDWSPDGEKIAFTRHPVTDDPNFSVQAEIYLMNSDGTGLERLTFNNTEERGPSWSPDGNQIVFACGGDRTADFEICVMNGDGTPFPDGTFQKQLTENSVFDGGPTFSPDGQQILFHRTVGAAGGGNQQLFIMNSDGTPFPDGTFQKQLTFGTRTTPDGLNNIAQWGELRVKVDA